MEQSWKEQREFVQNGVNVSVFAFFFFFFFFVVAVVVFVLGFLCFSCCCVSGIPAFFCVVCFRSFFLFFGFCFFLEGGGDGFCCGG